MNYFPIVFIGGVICLIILLIIVIIDNTSNSIALVFGIVGTLLILGSVFAYANEYTEVQPFIPEYTAVLPLTENPLPEYTAVQPFIPEYMENSLSEEELIEKIKNQGFWNLETDIFNSSDLTLVLDEISTSGIIPFRFHNINGHLIYKYGYLNWDPFISLDLGDTIKANLKSKDIKPPPLTINGKTYQNLDVVMYMRNALVCALGKKNVYT
jgi:hypothetical protein